MFPLASKDLLLIGSHKLLLIQPLLVTLHSPDISHVLSEPMNFQHLKYDYMVNFAFCAIWLPFIHITLNLLGFTSKFKSSKTLNLNTCVSSARGRHLILRPSPLSCRLVLLPHLSQSPGVFFRPQPLHLSRLSLHILLNRCSTITRLRAPHNTEHLGCRRPTGS